jgi:hypothetical protein
MIGAVINAFATLMWLGVCGSAGEGAPGMSRPAGVPQR